jgi:hypothetical protein
MLLQYKFLCVECRRLNFPLDLPFPFALMLVFFLSPLSFFTCSFFQCVLSYLLGWFFVVSSCTLLSTLGDIMVGCSYFIGDFVIKIEYIVLFCYN